MNDESRLADLRRRVQADPTSIAFAALAEELRRAGRYEEAVAACRAGLIRHPAYISARVTLGRALSELGDLDAAEAELSSVLEIAPDNLTALRALSDVQQHRGAAATWQAPSARAIVIPFQADPISVESSAPILSSLDRFLDAIVTRKRAVV